MICTAVIASKCIVLCVFVINSWFFDQGSHSIAFSLKLGVILAVWINKTTGQSMKNIFYIIYGIGIKDFKLHSPWSSYLRPTMHGAFQNSMPLFELHQFYK